MGKPEEVKYITDENGEKKVVLPAESYEELLEDIQDLVAIAERKDEETISLDELKKNLKADGVI